MFRFAPDGDGDSCRRHGVRGRKEELVLACRYSLVPCWPSLQSASGALSFVLGPWQVTVAWDSAGH